MTVSPLLLLNPAGAPADRSAPCEASAMVPPRPGLAFRGWAVVAGSFLIQAICFGSVYSFPAFAGPLQESFGASDLSMSLVYAVSGAMAFATGAISGPLADRVGARWPVSAGMLVMAAGFLAASAAERFEGLLLSYGLLVGTGAGLAYVPALAAVQRWFVAWRGLASGIATAGVGAGTAMVPLTAGLLSAWGDWRVSFMIVGGAIALVGPLAAALIANSPEDCGLRPDGATPVHPAATRPDASAGPAALEGLGLAQALRTRRFLWLLSGCFLLSVPVALPFAAIATTAREAGLDAAEALSLLSLIGGGSIAGRLLLGAGADRLGRGRALLACGLGVAAMMGWWASATGLTGYALFAIAFGLFQGGFVALLPSFVVDLYGRRSAGGLIGALFAGRALAVLAGAPCAAAMTPVIGQAGPLWAAGGLALLGTFFLACAARGEKRTQATRAAPCAANPSEKDTGGISPRPVAAAPARRGERPVPVPARRPGGAAVLDIRPAA